MPRSFRSFSVIELTARGVSRMLARVAHHGGQVARERVDRVLDRDAGDDELVQLDGLVRLGAQRCGAEGGEEREGDETGRE